MFFVVVAQASYNHVPKAPKGVRLAATMKMFDIVKNGKSGVWREWRSQRRKRRKKAKRIIYYRAGWVRGQRNMVLPLLSLTYPALSVHSPVGIFGGHFAADACKLKMAIRGNLYQTQITHSHALVLKAISLPPSLFSFCDT